MWQKLAELDNRLSRLSRLGVNGRLTKMVAAILAHSGDSWFWLLGLFLLWWFGNEYWKQRAVALGAGILVTALVVMAIKYTVRRSRPEGQWGQIYRSTDPHSFPSGHAARSMMLAVMALGLGPLWFGLLLLAWAPLVSLARVMLGVHYPSDVIAGMALGAVLGVIVLQFF
jgi:undecaprenyl-diphosphatase